MADELAVQVLHGVKKDFVRRAIAVLNFIHTKFYNMLLVLSEHRYKKYTFKICFVGFKILISIYKKYILKYHEKRNEEQIN